MRYETIIARSFGPFKNTSLNFTKGLNIIFGPNEAGKSSWHAAMYVGLCGIRRARGRAREFDQNFTSRHKPWDGDAWRVEALIQLADGRKVILRHDLAGLVDCRAEDALLGRDLSSEIMWDGSPDGSRWLGLNRQAFMATGFICQADLLGVLQNPDLLEEHLQRMAASSGADATAGAAIEVVERYQSEHVGQERANSAKPLRRAMDQRDTASEVLRRGRGEHQEWLELAEEAQVREEQLRAAEGRLMRFDIACAQREVEREARRLMRAEEIAAKYPASRAADSSRDPLLANEIAGALGAWAQVPVIQKPTGPSPNALSEQIAALPEMPTGDLDPDPELKTAVEELHSAETLLSDLESQRPPTIEASRLPAVAVDQLREKASHLAAGTGLTAEDEVVMSPLSGRALMWAGAGLVLIGGTVLLLGEPIIGVPLLLLGILLLLWNGLRPSSEPNQVGHETFRVHQYEEARRWVVQHDLPVDPDRLRYLATEIEQAERATHYHTLWQTRFTVLQTQKQHAEERLANALQLRNIRSNQAAASAYKVYEAACRERRQVADQARKRQTLELELAAAQREEYRYQDLVQRQSELDADLRRLAGQCGLENQDDTAAVMSRLKEWQSAQQGRKAAHETALVEAEELRHYLQGRSLAERQLEVRRQQEQIANGVARFGVEQMRTVVIEEDSENQRVRLHSAFQDARQARDTVFGRRSQAEQTLLSVADAEEALASYESEIGRLRSLDRVLDTAGLYLKRAQDRTHRAVAPILNEALSKRLPNVTSGRYTTARVDPETLRVQVSGDGEHWRDAARLSHGTAEQVYLLLRIAMAERIAHNGEVCPLLLDDVTVQSDRHRTLAILEALHVLSEERQVVLFSQEQGVLEWAQSNLTRSDDQIIILDPLVVPV